MGDAVYEQYIREHLLRKFGSPHADKLNWLAIEYVRADGQAACAKEMLDSGFLTEEETARVKNLIDLTVNDLDDGTLNVGAQGSVGAGMLKKIKEEGGL